MSANTVIEGVAAPSSNQHPRAEISSVRASCETIGTSHNRDLGHDIITLEVWATASIIRLELTAISSESQGAKKLCLFWLLQLKGKSWCREQLNCKSSKT